MSASEVGGAELRWIRLGIGAGLAASLVYPAMIFLPLPMGVGIPLIASFGPLLGVASVGTRPHLNGSDPRVASWTTCSSAWT